MKKTIQIILLFLLTFTTSILFTKSVYATEITVNDVITYMESNNLFKQEDYFNLFGHILNGNDEYKITEFKYTIDTTSTNININVTLNDETTGSITKTTTLTYNDNVITYNNPNPVDSLESRIDTILLIELMYSIGGARGYNELVLVNWMNQIDLKNSTDPDGIDSIVETVKYDYEINGQKLNYTVDIPTSYTIRINELTDTIPANDYVKLTDVKKTDSTITIRLFADGNLSKECELYRLNNNNKFEKIATVSCNNGEYTDEKLKDNETYTYQATIKNEIVCSDNLVTKTNEVPNTGITLRIEILIIAIIVSIGLYFLTRKYNTLKKV